MHNQENSSNYSLEGMENFSYFEEVISVSQGTSDDLSESPQFLHRLKASTINNLEALNQARCLLYNCYVKEMQWHIEQNNYSGLYVDKTNPHFKLIDDYDEIATWFSVKNENEVVACARLCPEDANGKLEMERYPEAKKMLWPTLGELKKKFRVVELNREAILPDDETDSVVRPLLLKKIFEYCILNRCAVITATPIKEWLTLYERLSFPRLGGCQFKYADADAEKVTVYFASDDTIQQMYGRLKII